MANSEQLERRLLDQIQAIGVVDVHTRLSHRHPFATTLRDLLSMDYFTELAHSAGLDKGVMEAGTPDEDMLPGVIKALPAIDNTIQYRWLMEVAQELFGFQHPHLSMENWEELATNIVEAANHTDREEKILRQAGIDLVFLRSTFDEDLESVNKELYTPCLHATPLIFQFGNPDVHDRLSEKTGVSISDSVSLQEALDQIITDFASHNAGGATISLPPGFKAFPVLESDMDLAISKALQGKPLNSEKTAVLHCGMLFMFAELCQKHNLPIQIMWGAAQNVYKHGISRGRSLPVSGDTIRPLLPLFNRFPELNFCVSVLSDSQAQELVSYGGVMQNVVVNGHWWYQNVPAYIKRDLEARLQTIPKTKLIGYYSDMHRLEFGLPKFNMYRRCLAEVLANDVVENKRATEEQAVQIARFILSENARRIFNIT
jgi:glucuronate isomerase